MHKPPLERAKRKVLAKTEPELVWFRRKRLAVKYFMFRMLQNVGDKVQNAQATLKI